MNITPDQIWALATSIITIATIITAITPSESDNEWVAKAQKFLNILAGNVYKNKNKDAK